MKYSLANYILSIEPNDAQIKQIFGVTTIGGEGSSVDSITLSNLTNIYDTTGYATGGWVHNKSLDRHGTATISINQLSDRVTRFIQLAKLSLSGDYDGFTLSLTDIEGNKIATCVDCYIQNIPEQAFASTAANQTWTFTCGQINYN